ncbi:hypothetical protein ABE222_23555 [Bacillus tropicus]|uniref:hypothetical protein n=1 Tax=Bacillus tropicus TaxID=2026188 RepID=UPI003D20C3CE
MDFVGFINGVTYKKRYSSVFEQDAIQAMKNASSESTIKWAVLNELRQEKKQKSRDQNATDRKLQVNLKRLSKDEN